MFIRSMVNGAVHFAGGVVLGVLSVFAAKGAADMMAGGGMPGGGGNGGGHGFGSGTGHGTTATANASYTPPDSSAGRGFDKAEGI